MIYRINKSKLNVISVENIHRNNAVLQLIHKTINSQFTSGISLINTPNCSYTQLEQKPWVF